MYIPRRLRRKHLDRQKLILYGMIGAIGLIVVGFLFSFAVFAWYARDLPSPGKLSQTTGFSTVFYDRDGKVLYNVYKDKNRVPVASNHIADYLKKATVAVEDKSFYTHPGISETGIIRAFINTILGRGVEGGSTITQQLIKNTLLTSQRALSRKIKEAILATEVEKKYTKDEILTMYLNEAPYGGSYWGVGSAARAYFGKEPKDLNLVESAILAGLPQSPTYYSPFIGKDNAWRGRAKDVLRRMREDGYITSDQEKKADDQLYSVKFASPKLEIQAPHFVIYEKQLVENEFGPKLIDQGVKVQTTLSLDIQQTVEKIVKDEIDKLTAYHVDDGAVVVLDSQTGEILAMVGSYDFNKEGYGQFNAATAPRQPGSTVKPITYAVAFEKGYTPATVLMDVDTHFPIVGSSKDYEPVNYDGKFHGPVQVRFALGNSMNIPAVKMLAMVGLKDFMQKADQMGLHTFAPTDENMKKYGLSITLGGGETNLLDLTSAYSIFARGGTKKDTYGIKEIKDFNDKSIFKNKSSTDERVLSPEVSFLISHILSDNNARTLEFGPNSYLNVAGKTVAVKTGTTDDKRDNYTIGYTKSLTVGVWVGNHDNSPMNQKIASGITGASPIWHDIMTQLLKKYPDGIMDKPDKVKAVEIDAYLGGLPKDGYPKRTEYFVEGTEPKDVSPFYKKLKISKANGKLANDVEIKSSNYDEKDFIVITENDPISTDGHNRWQEAIDAWEQQQSDDKFKPPKETSDNSSSDVIVSIKSPNDKSQVSNNFDYHISVATVDSIKNVKIYANNNEVKNYDGDNRDINGSIHLDDGTYEFKVVAINQKDKHGETSIHIGVNKPWDTAPTAASNPTLIPSPTDIIPNNKKD